jgi:DNA-binding CsgD family transcriptional regulator/tetratricopeptide (TPR) repeat protein
MAALGSSPDFVGRRTELGLLEEALERVRTESSAAFVVGGESGVGKTRLVVEFAGRARRSGATVLMGSCIDMDDGALPYWPFVDALRGLLRRLGAASAEALGPLGENLKRLLPELDAGAHGATPAGPGAQARLFELVLGILLQLARRSPVVLVLEDMHWADRSTRDLLSFLLANLGPDPVLVVATYRSDALVGGHPLHALLAELRRNRRARFLELSRFTHEEIVAQITGIVGLPPRSDLAEAIWARSDGNAFFAEELLFAAVDGVSLELPPSLRQILLTRVDGLTPAAQDVLRLVAAGGPRVPYRLLAAASPRDERDLLSGLRECVAQLVLVPDDDRNAYGFRHSLLREAIYDELLPGERARLHAAYGAALERDPGLAPGSAPAELAYHWYEAGDVERALPAAVAAARAAERVYGFAEAQRQYERALELWDRASDPAAALLRGPNPEVVDTDRLGLFERAAEAANLAGDHHQAITLMEAAIREPTEPDPIRCALLRERLGAYLWSAGDSQAALAAYDEAARLVPADARTAERARVVGAQAQALMLAGHYRESQARAQEALAVAREAGARALEGSILGTLGFDLAFLGHPAAGVSLLQEARLIAEDVGTPDEVGRAWLNLAELLSGPLNRLHEAAAVAEQGAARVSALGLDRSYGVSLLAIAVNAMFRLGRWSEVDHFLTRAMASRPAGTAAIDLGLARAKLAVGRGDVAAAEADLAAVEELCARAVGARYQTPLLTLRAGLALWEGRIDDARAAVAEGLRAAAASDDAWSVAPLVWHGLRAEADRAEDARARRATWVAEEARRAGADLLNRVEVLAEESADAAPTVRQAVGACLALCRAEWSRLEGVSAPEAWAVSAATWDALGQPYPAAYARWRQAEALLTRRARSPRAAEALRSAHRVARELGADAFRRQIEDLAARGRIALAPAGDGEPDGEDGVDGSGPDPLAALTRRERDVLALVAEGRSNREVAEALFISEKTASVHVSHILAKLGVSSRVAAGAVAHRLGVPVPRS